ncbi:hypothetical protein [Flagellimonas sp. CMM7]|uniref:hypothetical protein n=1 Tax=Flagellimonas sp. CMM7 TaxID=2654676 RepID=UPI0013D0BC51|nr:hypothetical protein [Flagellimonas sp. CMM7]UII79575.1 hypothetical protein LV704_18180 [Flagellimonas sp. CMM7]
MKNLFILFVLMFPLFVLSQTHLDEIQNLDETGIDCGGSSGNPCVNGKAIKAYPSAEGAGKYATGGRAGVVYKVTNCNNSGLGSLNYGMTQISGARIIVFQVGCLIDKLEQETVITDNNISLYAQTAPSDSGGVTLANGNYYWRGDNYICTNMRFASGDFGYKDAQGNIVDSSASLQGTADAVGLRDVNRAIFSFNSVRYGVDENMSASHSNYITFSHNIIALALAYANHGDGNGLHSMAGIIDKSNSPGYVSHLKNYAPHNDSRNLRSSQSVYEMINDVFYGFRGQNTFGSGQTFSAMYNHWQKRTGQDVYNGQTFAQQNDATWGFGGAVYFEGNTRNHSVNVMFDADYDTEVVASRELAFSSGPMVIWNSTQVVDSVLAYAGALPRDAIDLEVIADYSNDTGHFINSQSEKGGFHPVAQGTPWPDVDNDGIDDNWESLNGLNVGLDDAMDYTLSNEYPNVELWVHDLDPRLKGTVSQPPVVASSSLIKANRSIINGKRLKLNNY